MGNTRPLFNGSANWLRELRHHHYESHLSGHQGPNCRTGFAVCLALLVMAAVLMVGFVVGLRVENGKRRVEEGS